MLDFWGEGEGQTPCWQWCSHFCLLSFFFEGAAPLFSHPSPGFWATVNATTLQSTAQTNNLVNSMEKQEMAEVRRAVWLRKKKNKSHGKAAEQLDKHCYYDPLGLLLIYHLLSLPSMISIHSLIWSFLWLWYIAFITFRAAFGDDSKRQLSSLV